MPELVISGFEQLTKDLEFKAPTVLRKMAFNVDANLASAGRLMEERRAHNLRMGEVQKKGFLDIPRRRSKWDPKVGWVSTTRQAGQGGTGFRMASFGWERVKKATVTAPYSNQLANLWHRQSNPYRAKSPLVGSPGHYMRWKEGEQRPMMYQWSQTYNILASLQGQAIAKTEAQFAPQLEEFGK